MIDPQPPIRSFVAEPWYKRVPIELHGHRKKLDFILQRVEAFRESRGREREDVSVLEVGCSNGRNLSLPLADQGFRVTGVDIHPPSIAWAKENSKHEKAEFVCADFNDFITDERFDVVVMSDILEHVDDPLHVIQLALLNLASDSIVLVCIPNGYGPYENEQRLLRVTRIDKLLEVLRCGVKRLLGRPIAKHYHYNYDSGHIQFFSMRDFRRLAREAGLRIDLQFNGALFGGGLTYPIGILLPFIVKPSLWLADFLPPSLVATWYFQLSRLPTEMQRD